MKKSIITIMMVMFSVLARAETVTVKWDLNDSAEKVTSYLLSVDGIMVWEGAAPPAVISIDANPHLFELQAKNEWWVSEPATVSLPAMPKPPTGITIMILAR